MPHCGDHPASHLGGTLEVVGGAGGHLPHEHFFGNAPAEQHRDVLQNLLLVHAVAVLLGQLHGHAQRTSARNDGDLVHRIGLGHQLGDHRVAGLVISGVPALVLGHDHGAALGAHDDLVLGALEVVHLDQTLVAARREQRRLVHQVGKIGTGESGRAARDDVGAHVRARPAPCACAR